MKTPTQRSLGPRRFFSLALTPQQQMEQQMAGRMLRRTAEQMGPKQFFGAVAHERPVELDHICNLVYDDLSNQVSPEVRGPLWGNVRPLGQAPGRPIKYFQLGHQWTFRHPDLPSPLRGIVYLEFVAEYCGTNDGGWFDDLGLFAEPLPPGFHLTYLTTTLWDTGSWTYPGCETEACRAVQTVDATLLAIFGVKPLLGHAGSPWLRIPCVR